MSKVKKDKIFLPDITPHLEKIRAENEAGKLADELKKVMQLVQPFPESELTPEKRTERIKKSNDDFWFWDKTYFPPEAYPDYAPAGAYHKKLIDITNLTDKNVHIVIGPRLTAKTSHFKKKFIYDFLHGKRRFMAIGAETLDPPQYFLLDMIYFLTTNERILFDYKIQWLEQSTEKLYARSDVNPKGTYVDTLSIERSSKGRSRGIFLRFDYIYLTDWENLTSSITVDAVKKRIDKVNEMRTSLSDDGTMICDGNNFDVDCAQNVLCEENDKGILSEYFVIHNDAAWDETRQPKQRSIWNAKYPASTEDELKAMMKPKDDYDWAGSFQGRPKKKSGNIFPDKHYNEWNSLPTDLKSVTYTDPNCSLKTKGDTTALTVLGFSPSTQNFYISAAMCESYSSSNELLMDFLMIMKQWKQSAHIIDSAFDGNVAQESQWTNNIQNFSRIHQFPFPAITFKKYKVDDLVSPIESEWKKDKFFFPPGFSKTDAGKRYLKQTFSFRTKKAKKKDDAPDSMICAYTFLVDLGIAFITGGSGFEFKSVSNRVIHKI